ncbi:hypothetical protein [Clostridium sp. UBA4395]|uniref:hypothetical protein n=1 Tax=Clostridium sp. UBA4395 TaxID=1946360 RepID=UPI0032165AD7
MLELLLNDFVIDEKNSSNKDVGMEVFIHVTLDGIGLLDMLIYVIMDKLYPVVIMMIDLLGY